MYKSQQKTTADPDARITFTQAARLPEVMRDGRPAHVVTLWRWATRGIRHGERRIYLESWCVGGRRLTSAGAVTRFIDTLSKPADEQPTPAKVMGSPHG